MIKKNELRIGNYVMARQWRCEGLYLTEVKTISMGWGNIDGKNKYVLCINYEWVETGAQFGSSIEGECVPILLNEEWLLKFGFKEYLDNLFLDIKQRITLCYFDKNENQFSILQDGKEIALASGRVKYVHQLQNLYFALTGEELVYTQEGGI